jgi:hypothetical protein
LELQLKNKTPPGGRLQFDELLNLGLLLCAKRSPGDLCCDFALTFRDISALKSYRQKFWKVS